MGMVSGTRKTLDLIQTLNSVLNRLYAVQGALIKEDIGVAKGVTRRIIKECEELQDRLVDEVSHVD